MSNGEMSKLTKQDLEFVVRRLPRDVRALLHDGAGLMLGGGFIRATIAGETPADIDLFGYSKYSLTSHAEKLASDRSAEGYRTKVHTSRNAITVLSSDGRLSVQFITRWLFDTPEACARSFDFTVCQAVVWFDGKSGVWQSLCSDRFYPDLAARRLTYTSPVRDEEAGGSLMRVFKYVKRGYSIQSESLGACITRLFDKVRADGGVPTEAVIVGLLREVDPLLVLDGLSVVDDGVHHAQTSFNWQEPAPAATVH